MYRRSESEQEDKKEPFEPMTIDELQKYYPVIFSDFTGQLNLLSNLTNESYKQLLVESKNSISLLEASHVHFESLFIQKSDYLLKCDHFLKIR